MKYAYTLCAGRHDTPAKESIFPAAVNPLDVDGLYAQACAAIPADCTDLDLYVTGLSVALLAVVRVCQLGGISLTCYHYDRDSGTYYPQVMTRFETCGFCGQRYGVENAYCPHCGSN